MAYSTAGDIRVITNFNLEEIPTTTMAEIIATADRRCDARIAEAGISLPIAEPYPDTLRDASANFAAAILLNRKRIDLSRPNSLSLEGLSFGTSPEAEIQRHETIARQSLERYIATAGGAGTQIYVLEGD